MSRKGRNAAPRFQPKHTYSRGCTALIPPPRLTGWILIILRQHPPTLLTGQPADNPDRLMDPSRVAKAQLRVVFTLQHFVVLDQGLA